MKKILLCFAMILVIFLAGCKTAMTVTYESNGGSEVPEERTFTQDFDYNHLPTPTKQGYDFDGWFLNSELTNPVSNYGGQSKITLYAKWKVASTLYKVEHYQEKIDGSYQLVSTDNFYQPTNTEVNAVAKTYEGFSEHETHSSRIASGVVEANGSLVLKLYYLRNVYTITIDENGAEEIGDITAKFGALVTAPQLTRPGYTFNGWNQTFPTTMPLNGLTIQAQWLELGQIIVSFDSTGGSSVENQIIYTGEKATLPTTPEKTGYTFDGWTTDEAGQNEFDFNSVINDTLTLYAKWAPAMVTYKVSYYQENAIDSGYTLFETEDLTALTASNVNALIKSYQGFSENLTHSSRVVSGTVLADGSLHLRVYYLRNIYKVFIDEKGGSSVDDLNIKFGATITPLPSLTKLGYLHDGFDGVFDTMPANDITISTKWKPDYVSYQVIHYQENANDDDYTVVETQNLTELTETIVEAEIKNYLGFTENLNHSNRIVTSAVLADGSLILKVYYQRNQYTVSFNVDGGSEISSITKKFGQTLSKPSDPTKTGHSFINWFPSFQSTEAYTFSTMPMGDFNLYAKWTKNIYTITFESNANISVTSLSAVFDDVISAPETPIRIGYEFKGWFSDEDLTDLYQFNRMPGYHFTLYAKWEGLPATINFNSNGGSAVSPVTLPAGSVVDKPIPTKEGYHFVDWYLDQNCINRFESWEMPVGGATLYAKWEGIEYDIIFVTNGGNDLDPLTARYQSQISLPTPTKTDFIFDGWYTDLDLTIKFNGNTMPLNGITLYAKWADPSNENQIVNILKQDFGSLVSLDGYVFAKLSAPYYGFYIYDVSGAILILADPDLVEIGDRVTMDGYLEVGPMINGVTNLVILSSNNQLIEPLTQTVAQINAYEDELINYYRYLTTSGILINRDGCYYLIDLNTFDVLKLHHRFYDFYELNTYLNSLVTMDLLLATFVDGWEAGIVNIILETVTTEDKALYVQNWILNQYQNLIFFENDYFDIPESNIFGFDVISYQSHGDNAAIYNSDTKRFGFVADETVVTFEVDVVIDYIISTFTFDVTVKPKTITPIVDVINGSLQQNYLIQGIVVMNLEDYGYLLKDDTAQIYIVDYDLALYIGQEVILKISRSTNLEMVIGTDAAIIEVISEANPLNFPAQEDTFAAFKAMDLTNPLNYGRYIEVRGFLKDYDDEYHNMTLEKNNQSILIYPIGYQAFEKLFEFINVEVIIRGYTVQLTENEWMLLFVGVREDIKIPEYTDQELVNILQAIFVNEYANRTFRPMDKFDLPKTHPLLGANITWALAENSLPYFDMEKMQFKVVSEEVNISINITITKNDTVLNFTYNTVLKPLEIPDNFYELNQYDKAFIQGLVVFRHPEFAYILSHEGLIYVECWDLDIYQGDYVVLYGEKRFSNYDYGASYLVKIYGESIPIVVGIISRDNPIVIPKEVYTINQINQFDKYNSFVYNQYVEVSGYLTDLSYKFELQRGDEKIIVETCDDYTYHRLKAFKDSYVTLRGYIYNYDEYRSTWIIKYTGLVGESIQMDYTLEEKFDIIEDDLMTLYQNNAFVSHELINFITSHPQTSASIAFETYGINANIINVTTGVIEPVAARTYVEIKATITIGNDAKDIFLTITIDPSEIIINPDLLTIALFKETSFGDISTFQAQVIALATVSEGTCLLLADESGMIYFYVNQYYYYLTGMIGKTIEVTGALASYRGRLEVAREATYEIISNGVASAIFNPSTIAQLVSLDHRNNEIFGQGVSFTGTIELEGWNRYYISDGYNRVRVFGTWNTDSKFSSYLGYQVTINGFIFGYLDNSPEFAIFVPDPIYSSYNPVIIKEYQEDEIVDFIEQALLTDYQNYILDFDGIYLRSSFSPFNNASITYQVVSGNYVSIIGSYLYPQITPNDENVVIEATITVGNTIKVVQLNMLLKGFVFNSFEELFVDNDNTEEINLKVTYLHGGWGYQYFLIEDNIYYLEYFFDQSYNTGDTLILTGKKYKIDGIVDYTFEINSINTDDNPELFNAEAVPMTIEQVYLIGNSNDISDYLLINGYLRYNPYTDSFYIEMVPGGYRFSIRNRFSHEVPSAYSYPINCYEFSKYIDEYVYMKVLFPNKKVNGDVYVVDFRGYSDEIYTPDYTPEDHIDISIRKFLERYSTVTLYSGQYLQVPYGDWLHNTSFVYNLQTETDDEYFDPYYNKASIVTQQTSVILSVDVFYNNDVENVKSFTFEVIIKPLPLSSAREALWGVVGELYLIEGIVQTFSNNWLIISDDSGTIYISSSSSSDYFKNQIQIGDKVVVIGERSTYYNGDYVPTFNLEDIKFISSGHQVSEEPINFTYQDILRIDYTNPDEFNKYISITGMIVSTGYYGYPSYALQSQDGFNYRIELNGQDYNAFNAMMAEYVGEEVTINGYLIGFNYIYSPFDWVMMFDCFVI